MQGGRGGEGGRVMADAIERVSLTHLKDPYKVPFRNSGGRGAVKDAIQVDAATAGGRVGLGESSPMAASFGYSADTPEGCWDDLATRIVPGLLGAAFEEEEEVARLASAWDGCSRFAVAGAETAC